MIFVKEEPKFRPRPILGQTESMQNQKSFDPNERNMNNKTFAEELKELHLSSIKENREKESMNVRTDRPEVDIFRKRPILGNRILVPSPNRDKPVKVKEPVQNVIPFDSWGT